ncbi:MAG: 4-alpha-glucanotransferase [Bacteroidales bacterium]|nr:4-alpha-glucanotransferase [Bacteroidales bacterium]
MKINFTLDYHTQWGEKILIKINATLKNETTVIEKYLDYNTEKSCSTTLELPKNSVVTYKYYLVNENLNINKGEYGAKRMLSLNFKEDDSILLKDVWQTQEYQTPLNSCAFTDSILKQSSNEQNKRHNDEIDLNVKNRSSKKNSSIKKNESSINDNKVSTVTVKTFIPYLLPSQDLLICGNSGELGEWNPDNAILMKRDNQNNRYASLFLVSGVDYEYKFIIRNNEKIEWEKGENRVIKINSSFNIQIIQSSLPNFYCRERKFAGLSVPVFSLKSESDYGIGEFTDLIKLVDFCKEIGMSFIQILPINDTTITQTWLDSYPYKANSTFALHPIYINLGKAGRLSDADKMKVYRREGDYLNSIENIDYEAVSNLKWRYLHDLFDEKGNETLKLTDFKNFFNQNKDWLVDYAAFSYLRDQNQTADFEWWKELSNYNKEKVNELTDVNSLHYRDICFYYFVQYHLYKQLSQVHDYSKKNGVAIKGDIPIGICSQSADVWSNPGLFKRNSQAGAPPDLFSQNGQNWGFPTYNWSEMSKDNYKWWKNRFKNMSLFFDAYRIDHILGFFRIWEIPSKNILGIGGHFSPALPYSNEEIKNYGFCEDVLWFTKPHLRYDEIVSIFGDKTSFVIDTFLENMGDGWFDFNSTYDTEAEIENFFIGQCNEDTRIVREKLLMTINDFLFIKDPIQNEKYHPRISAFDTFSFKRLNQQQKESYTNLYNDFFYKRHNLFWAEVALKKLPALINSTNMLVCGEDLGMIPDCVPEVMKKLDILSLDIERMPKEFGVEFGDVEKYDKYSVCTTSTHDMSTLREWWNEDKDKIQRYYNQVLKKDGKAPSVCDEHLCKEILNRNLHSPSILAIFPIQDWLSVRQDLCNENPAKERINEPSNARHYWRYRMKISIENLYKDRNLKQQLKQMIIESKRNV